MMVIMVKHGNAEVEKQVQIHAMFGQFAFCRVENWLDMPTSVMCAQNKKLIMLFCKFGSYVN